jgi:HK97 family phage portal protein
MGLISEFRTSLENPSTPLSYPAEWLLDIFNGGRTDSGMRVSELTALQVSTVWACCEIKGGALGSLDIKVYERIINDANRLQRRIAHEHDYWDLLASQPNPEMTSFTLRKTVQVHRMLWGNGYVELQRDGGNRIVALWPRNPARMKARRAEKSFLINDDLVRAGELFYATTEGVESIEPNPESPDRYVNERPIHQLDMLHIPGLSLDGRLGQEVIILARNAIGLALATEKFGGKFFGNGAVGMGVFKFPTLLSPEDREVTKRSLQESWGGENMLRPILLEAGMEYVPTSTDPDKAQAIQTREHQVIEICRVLNTPPHMVGVSSTTSRANAEQIGQEFLTFSLNQDLVAFQQEINRKVLPSPAMGRSAGKKFGMYFDTWPLIVPSANDMRQFYCVDDSVWSIRAE